MTEKLWQIPTSWAWVPIRELGEVVSGGTPSTKDGAFWGDDIVWFSPADLTGYSAKFIRQGAKSLSELGLRNSSAQVMPAGSVMFSSRAPIGYVAIIDVDAATNQGFKSVVPNPAVFNEYLYYYLRASKSLAEERATGTTFKEISGSTFSGLPVPVASLPEQHRIVTKIEELFSELDKAVESLTLARAQLTIYRKVLLKAAFDGKLTIDWRAANPDKLESAEILLDRIHAERLKASKSLPLEPIEKPSTAEASAGWAWVSVDAVTAESLIGLVRAASEQSNSGEGASYIKMDRIDMDGGLDIAARIFVSTTPAEIKRYGLKGGDILFNTRNSVELVGKTGLVRSDPEQPTVYNNNLMRIRSVPSVLPGFLAHQMCGHSFRRRMEGIKKATTSVAAVYGRDLWPLPILVPSIAEQAEIVRILDEKLSVVDAALSENKVHIARISALRRAILKQAFSGKLVPQDPADEPAAALLERIRKQAPLPPARRRKIS